VATSRQKAFRKQSEQSSLPSVCPFDLYAFCILSEHRFGKVGKSQEAHKSASLEINQKGFCEAKSAFFVILRVVVGDGFEPSKA
jgi:hypothetical protein